METGTEHPHLYRFGFLVTNELGSIARRPDDRWRYETHGNLELLLHKETEVHRVEVPMGSALILGWAFPIGESSMQAVIERIIAAPENEVAKVLGQISGRFCLIVQTPGGTRAFTDPFGSRSVFYSYSRPGTLASHAELLAQHFGVEASERAQEFTQTDAYRKLSVKYLPGDSTMYGGIRCLIPNHALLLGAARLERMWPSASRQASSFEEFFGRCDLYFASLARGLGRRAVFLGLTGGIDTRFLLAGLAKHGLDLQGMTWLGNYHDSHERPIIDEISRRMGIANTFIELPGARDEIAEVAGRNGGNARGVSRLTSAIKAAFPAMQEAVFVRGYGGEIIRGFYNLLNKPIRDGSSEEMYRVYASKSKAETIESFFQEFARDAFAAFAERAGYDERLAALSYDPNDLFYWEQRMGNWAAAMLNEMDPAMFSVTGLNDRVLYDLAFGLPTKLRLKKSLFTRYIDRSEPRLSGLPII